MNKNSILIRHVNEAGIVRDSKPTIWDLLLLKIGIVSNNLRYLFKEHIHHDGTTPSTVDMIKKISKVQSKYLRNS